MDAAFGGGERLALVVRELRRVKSQIYFVQQSIVRMREKNFDQTGEAEQAEGEGSGEGNGQDDHQGSEALGRLNSLRRQLKVLSESCVSKAELVRLEDRVKQREEAEDNELLRELARTKSRLRSAESRLDTMDEEARKRNLLISGQSLLK